MPVARDRYRPPRGMGRIQAAWTVVMDDEHNKIDQADLDQFVAETLAEIDKRLWPTTKTPRVVHSQDHETTLVAPTTLGLAMAGLGHPPPLPATQANGCSGWEAVIRSPPLVDRGVPETCHSSRDQSPAAWSNVATRQLHGQLSSMLRALDQPQNGNQDDCADNRGDDRSD